MNWETYPCIQFLLAEVVTNKNLPFLIALEIRIITSSNLKTIFSPFFMYTYICARISHSLCIHMSICSQAQENKIQKGWELRQEFTEKILKTLILLSRFLYLKHLCGWGVCVSMHKYIGTCGHLQISYTCDLKSLQKWSICTEMCGPLLFHGRTKHEFLMSHLKFSHEI